ncbi:MAG: response regulator [Clostridiaceae bacterium]|nr:response regulator [Clostridiaceae bacterium]
MINILIVEDDEIQRKNFINMIKELGNNYNIFEAENNESALVIAKTNDINLFFIDIKIGSSLGIDLGYRIREVENYKLTWIVFIAAFATYMIEAFKQIHCYDYIIKPYEKEKVKAMTRILTERLNSLNTSNYKERAYVIFDLKEIQIKIFKDEIIFVEIFIRTCIIHTKGRKYYIEKLSLKKLLIKIQNSTIIQSHRSYIINIKYIKYIYKDAGSWRVEFDGYNEVSYIGDKFKRYVSNLWNNINLDL